VLQSGPRDDVFNRPVSPHAGKLLGVQNVLPGRVLSINDGIASIDVAGAEWQFLAKGLSENQAITVGARAQDLIAFPDAHGASTLVREIDSGLHRTVVVSLPRGAEVYAELTAEMDRRVGRTLPSRWSLSVATGTGFVWNDAADDQCLLSSCS
jgi:ABC-type sulfate/molybdate transport systems ATPase subunit